MGKEGQRKKSKEQKRWKEGLSKIMLASKLLWGWQSLHLQQDEHKCSFSAPGYCPSSAWDKPQVAAPQPPQLALQPLSSSHSQAQAWEKLKIGLTMNMCCSGAVRHYLCKILLSPPSSLTVERCWRAPTALSCREERMWETRSFFTQFTFQARGESREGLGTKIDVWPMALSRTCSFKTGQWLGRIEGCDLSDAAAVLLTEGDK